MVEISIPVAVGAVVALVCHVFSIGPKIGLRCKRAGLSFGLAAMTVLCFAPEMWQPSLWIVGLLLLIVLYQVGAIVCMLLLCLGGSLKRLVCPAPQASV